MMSKISERNHIVKTKYSLKSSEVLKDKHDSRGYSESDTCRRIVTIDRDNIQIMLINQSLEEKIEKQRFSCVDRSGKTSSGSPRCQGRSRSRSRSISTRRSRARRYGRYRSLCRLVPCRPSLLQSPQRRTPTNLLPFSAVNAAFSACDISINADGRHLHSSDAISATRIDSFCDSDDAGSAISLLSSVSSTAIPQNPKSVGKNSVLSPTIVNESSPTHGTTVSNTCEELVKKTLSAYAADSDQQAINIKSDCNQVGDHQNLCDIVKACNRHYFPGFKQTDTKMKLTETDDQVYVIEKEGYMFMAEDFFQVWKEAKELDLEFPLALSMPSSMSLVKM